MYKLHIRDDAGKTKVVTVKRDKITVGRQEGNTIRLTDRNVSRIHARIVRKDGQIFLEDVSRYGTRVNGLRMKEKKLLSAEDVVVIGDYELKVETKGQKADTVPATPKAPGKPKKESKRQEAPTTVEKSVGSVDSTSMINLNDIEQAAREQASKKTRIVADVATLVAVNTELAGTEYRLSGSEIVIGRTDENDVIVDHRSISRNHARIVAKGGRITVFDLDSANGLKINDEFYKQSVLRRGDVIELGHVRMRFVETGETFVYRPEEWSDRAETPTSAPMTQAPQGGSKLWIVALLGLVAVGGVFAVVWSGGDSEELDRSNTATVAESSQNSAAGANAASSQGASGETSGSQAAASAAKPNSGGESLEARIAKIDRLLSAKKWKEAQRHCGAILDEDSSVKTAQSCVEKANVELTTATALADAERHVDNEDFAKAWKALATVRDFVAQSSLSGKIERLQKSIKPRYLDGLEAKGKRLLKSKRYDVAIQTFKAIRELDPSSKVAINGLNKARKGKAEESSVAAADSRAEPTPKPVKEAPKAKEPVKKEPKKEAKKDPPKKADPPPSDSGGKLTWKEYRRMAAKAGGGRLAVYKEAASKGYAQAYFYIGRTCQTQGKKGEAIKAYKKFIRLRPGSAKAEQAKQALMSLGASF